MRGDQSLPAGSRRRPTDVAMPFRSCYYIQTTTLSLSSYHRKLQDTVSSRQYPDDWITAHRLSLVYSRASQGVDSQNHHLQVQR